MWLQLDAPVALQSPGGEEAFRRVEVSERLRTSWNIIALKLQPNCPVGRVLLSQRKFSRP